MESKNTTTFDDLNKTKNMKDESNRTQNEKGDKNINPILSPISYTNTLKLYNPSILEFLVFVTFSKLPATKSPALKGENIVNVG